MSPAAMWSSTVRSASWCCSGVGVISNVPTSYGFASPGSPGEDRVDLAVAIGVGAQRLVPPDPIGESQHVVVERDAVIGLQDATGRDAGELFDQAAELIAPGADPAAEESFALGLGGRSMP